MLAVMGESDLFSLMVCICPQNCRDLWLHVLFSGRRIMCR